MAAARPGLTLVTGSSGHLGAALVRRLARDGQPVRGFDRLAAAETDRVGDLGDRAAVRAALDGAARVIHAATLHKPHVATHAMEAFVEVNVRGTLVLLEEAAAAGVESVVISSSTTVFGAALAPPPGAPAAWITEAVAPVPKNIYGVTKAAAEELGQLFARTRGLPVVVLRLSRFFPERDDDPGRRAALPDANLKAVEYLYRRVDLADAVEAHLRAAARAPALGFGRFIVSATTPFRPEDAAELARDAPAVLARRLPAEAATLAALGWRMLPALDRVYDNAAARAQLGWAPATGFGEALARAAAGVEVLGPEAAAIGLRGYHRDAAGRIVWLG
jgi:nucleoside-diphosphate-sugar epimerase